jgi:hypothetical protein
VITVLHEISEEVNSFVAWNWPQVAMNGDLLQEVFSSKDDQQQSSSAPKSTVTPRFSRPRNVLNKTNVGSDGAGYV